MFRVLAIIAQSCNSDAFTSPTQLRSMDTDMPEQEHVAKIADWILAGMRPSQIPTQAGKEQWTIAEDELLDAIGAAYELLACDASIDVTREFAKSVNRLNFLYTRAIAIQDYKTALSIQKELNAFIARNQDLITKPE